MSETDNAWNKIFVREGRLFKEPHADVPRLARMIRARGGRTVLDLGCGTGRHVVYLAKSGFSVSGLDVSSEGIDIARQWLEEEGLNAELKLQSMTERLPYEDDSFDAVISVQAIHHARLAEIEGAISEISRVLRRAGLVFVTVPKLMNQAAAFEMLEPNTYAPLDGPETGLPHHYFTVEELRELFGEYKVLDVHLDEWNHHCLTGLKT